MPQIEVTFDLDANGILSVKAKDKTSGKEQSIRIEAKTSLSKEDIERMKKEAEVHAEEDKKKRELIDTKNMADQLIYTAEKSLREAGDKVSEDTKKAVEEKVVGLKTAKDGDDKTKIDTASQELSQVMQKIGEEMAKATQPNPTSAEGASEAKPEGETGTDDNIKDAETK